MISWLIFIFVQLPRDKSCNKKNQNFITEKSSGATLRGMEREIQKEEGKIMHECTFLSNDKN